MNFKRNIFQKKSLLLTFLVFTALFSEGQTTKQISLKFSKDDFELRQNEEGELFVWSDVHNVFLKSDTLQPALPYIGFNVLIRNNDTYCSHVCSYSKIMAASNVLMAHNPKVIPTNIHDTTTKTNHTPIYSQRRYPETDVEFMGMNDCYGYRLLTFHVCPFEYDAIAKKLYLKNRVEIDITLSSSSSEVLARQESNNSVVLKNTIRQMVVNSDDLDEQNTPLRESTPSNNLTLQTGYEYVIVTSNQFKNAFQELANWKNRKGIRSKVITVEEIAPLYTGATTQEKIKRALADIDGLEYVLLGGDTLNVPTCMCFIGHNETADTITPADVYYSCLGTMNWDTNGNGLYGELDDNVSMIPTLNVSRAPVSSIEDVQTFVNRIINYECMPDTTNWKDNILMCGTSLGDISDIDSLWHPFYLNGQSDTQIWSQSLYNSFIHPSGTNYPSWNGELTRFYDTYTDISLDGSYDFNATNLQTELAKGYTFADVMTHGSISCWRMEGNYPFYDSSSADLLQNTSYTVITTTACLTNAFDYHSSTNRCLSQHFLNNPNSGILAYWGTSRENWYNPRTFYIGFSPNVMYDGWTYRKLFDDKYHRMGKAPMAVKTELLSHAVGSYKPYRKIWMGLNLMGDPEMPVYLSKPKVFQNVSIQFVNDSIYVDAGTPDFDICFINQSDSTDYYIARDIVDSVVVFSRLNGVYDVCITKPGYIPYTTVCGDTTYLQNITMTGVKSYNTNNAMIGSDVTDKVAQGPVVVSNGSTSIKISQGATITKDFEVLQGAEFTITN